MSRSKPTVSKNLSHAWTRTIDREYEELRVAKQVARKLGLPGPLLRDFYWVAAVETLHPAELVASLIYDEVVLDRFDCVRDVMELFDVEMSDAADWTFAVGLVRRSVVNGASSP